MSALTLAMNEVQGVNSEDFLAVRAYHSLGAGFRYVLFDERNNVLSPASSISSGVESYATTESERVSKDSGDDSGSESEHKVDSVDNSLAIIYDGRNILDLGKNIKPFTWQLSTFTQLSSPRVFFRIPSEPLHYYEPVRPSTPKICKNCSFTTPNEQPIRASKK